MQNLTVVYRVEDELGHGPFGAAAYDIAITAYNRYGPNRFPVPARDFPNTRPAYIYAAPSIYKLRCWFPKSVRRKLHKRGYKLYVFCAPCEMGRSKMQARFRREDATLVRSLSLLEI